jgi:hypothetical protein
MPQEVGGLSELCVEFQLHFSVYGSHGNRAEGLRLHGVASTSLRWMIHETENSF